MEFYNCLNRLCDQIGCTFDTAFLIALWGFALLMHFWFKLFRFLKVHLQNRKKDR